MEWIVEAETLSDLIDHGRYSVSSRPLIRCKDCKWSDTRPGVWDCHNPVFGDGYAYYSPPCMREDDYCSYGERRDNG